jgi:hypothetical protein
MALHDAGVLSALVCAILFSVMTNPLASIALPSGTNDLATRPGFQVEGLQV